MWLRLLPFGGAALIGAFLAWQAAGLWHRAEISSLEAKHRGELAGAIDHEREVCRENQNITKEIANDLSKKLSAADARHADAVHRLLAHEKRKQLQPANAANRSDAAPGADGFSGADSAAALAVVNGARNAERQTEQLIALQEFIRKTWAARGND